ncbi:MAG: hypothetical protein AABZ60_04810, partial [Planctomycetota bacterium]
MKPFLFLSLLAIVISGSTLAQHRRSERQYQNELSTLSNQLLDSVERLRKSFDDGYGEAYGYDSQFAPTVYQLKNLYQATEHFRSNALERHRDSNLLESFATLYDCFYQTDIEIGKLQLTTYQNQDYENIRTYFHKIAARFRNLPTHLDKTYTLADTVGNAISRNYELNALYYDYQNFLKSLRHLQEVSTNKWASPVHLNKDYNEVCSFWTQLYSTLLAHCHSGRRHQERQSLTDALVLQLDRYIRDTKIYLTLTYVQEVHIHNCQCEHIEYSQVHVEGCGHNHQHSCTCGCPEYLNYHYDNCGHQNYAHIHHCRCGHRRYVNQHYTNCGHEVHIHNCRCGHSEYADSHYASCGHTLHEHNCRCGCAEYRDSHYANCGHTLHVHNCRCGHSEYANPQYRNCGHTVHDHNCRS